MGIRVKNDLLRKYREDSGFTRAYVEEQTGVAQSRIVALEDGTTGNTKATVTYAEKLCDFYSVNHKDVIHYNYKEAKFIGFGMSKGGTGKSTTTGEIVYHLSKKFKLCVIDGDPQCNLSRILSEVQMTFDDDNAKDLARYLEVPEHKIRKLKIQEFIHKTKLKNVDIIRSHPDLFLAGNILKSKVMELGPYKQLKEKILDLGKYDFVLIDTPPNIDAATIGLYAMTDKFFVPLDMAPFTRDSIPTFVKAIEMVRVAKSQLFNENFFISGVIKTQIDKRLLVDRQISEYIDTQFGKLVVDIEIPRFEGVRKAQNGSLFLSEFDKDSERGKQLNKLFRSLAMEVIK
ncbi:MAG: AAA family ATPase [Clostridiales bacterium]|nr:AAA family ATPase [Clostridiales bacterium]